MSQPHIRTNEPLRRAIGRLVVGLEKRENMLRERRIHQRFNFHVGVHLCSKTDNNEYMTVCEAWALDISIGGIGCIAVRDIDTDDTLYISFEEVLGRPCYVPVHVKNSKELMHNVHMLNLEFVFTEDVPPVHELEPPESGTA